MSCQSGGKMYSAVCFYGLSVRIFLLLIWFIENATTVVQEKQVTSCNTPCDTLRLTCPPAHRLAIREALFSVTARPQSTGPCPLIHSCGTEALCCEQSPVQDCVFSYSPSHLEAVHRNCSGTRACAVKTERSQEESVACPFFRPEETVSHTVMDYVCIKESSIIDICMTTETQVVGRTLFTMLDTSRWRNPRGGAVCRCTAESVRWPTTNTIAVFVVDIRLNMLRQSQCSRADVTLKSGSTTRHLDCETSRDPRQAFPFIALLNHSNVATVELLLHKKLPEFIWIGFESNELEDIRLSCGLQGYVPVSNEDISSSEGSNGARGSYVRDAGVDGMPVGPITGGVVGILVILALVIGLVFILLYRRRQTKSKADDYSEPHDAVDDIDVYYSTPDIDASNPDHRQLKTSTAGNKVTTTVELHSGEITAEGSEGETYVTAEMVRERKRQSSKKKVRILSTPEISNDVAEYYASPWDIRDRRRQEEEGEDDVFIPELPPPPLLSPTVCNEAEDYAVLDRNRRSFITTSSYDACYDHLPQAKDSCEMDIIRNSIGKEKSNDGFIQHDRPEPDGCHHNAAYEDSEMLESST